MNATRFQESVTDVDRLRELIEQGREFDIIHLFTEMHAADIAELIDRLREEEKKRLFALLDVEKASDVISQLSVESRDQILEDLPTERLVQIVDDMESDDAADLLAELPEDQVRAALRAIDRVDSLEVQRLLAYEKDTAGGLMQAELVKVSPQWTLQEALESVREQAREVEDVHDIFVVDEHGRLLGALEIEDLILHPSERRVSEVMKTSIPRVTTNVDQEEVAHIFQKYDIITLPVVDASGRLLGRITVDDVVDVMEEEASEDFFKMAGIEGELVYSGRPFQIARLRLPWLLTNLFGGLLVGYLMWLFKLTLKEALVLVTFVPVITGMGGNAGIQSSTIIIRGFATGRLDMTRLWRHLFQEFRVAILMGTACGLVVGLVAAAWHGIGMLGFVVGTAMVGAITVANLMGTLVPALFKRLGIDPAVAAGPFVTTANDITGILIYLGIATAFIHLIR
jgi:magnesium transporter